MARRARRRSEVRGELAALLALLAVLTSHAPASAAEGQFFALIVNGSPNLKMDYDGGYLTVGFRRTTKPAGPPSGYARNVPPGAAAWPDRPLNSAEPLVLKQKMSTKQAEAAIQRLRQNGGFWKFYCRNTGKGYFE